MVGCLSYFLIGWVSGVFYFLFFYFWMFKLLFNRLGVGGFFFNCSFRLQIDIKKNWAPKKPTSVLTPGQIWHVAADRKTKERNEFYFSFFCKERHQCASAVLNFQIPSNPCAAGRAAPFLLWRPRTLRARVVGLGPWQGNERGPTEDSGICLILVCFFFFLKKAF
jgi:hypothetical protein